VLSVALGAVLVGVAPESGVTGGSGDEQDMLARAMMPAHTNTRHFSFRVIQMSTFRCHRVAKHATMGAESELSLPPLTKHCRLLANTRNGIYHL
jgi:hypothetical protein